jgi:hypothetical protein
VAELKLRERRAKDHVLSGIRTHMLPPTPPS